MDSCTFCGGVTLLSRCAKCGASYCDIECMSRDSVMHSFECSRPRNVGGNERGDVVSIERFREYTSSSNPAREFSELTTDPSPRDVKATIGKLPENASKNVSKEFLPWDEELLVFGRYDYLNASPVLEGEGISAQNPLPGTIGDFLQMVYDVCNDIATIIAIVSDSDIAEGKAFVYWPTERVPVRHSRFSLTPLEKASDVAFYAGPNLPPGVEFYAFHLSNTENRREHWPRLVHLFWYRGWTSTKNPEKTDSVRHLARIVASKGTELSPVVAHCVSGSNRSGALFAVARAIKLMSGRDPVKAISVKRIIRSLRRERMGSVSTPELYSFVYAAIADEIDEMRRT